MFRWLLADPLAGELCIGLTESMAFSLAPAVVNAMILKYPRIKFYFTQAEPHVLIERDLRGRRVEFIVGRGPITQGADLSVEILGRDRLTVIAGLTNPLSRRRKISLHDLVNERWAMPPPGHPVRTSIEQAFNQHGLQSPTDIAAVGSALLTTRMVAGGNFIAVIGSAALDFDLPSLGVKALPVDLVCPDWYISIITLKKRPLSSIAKRFIECARDVVDPIMK